MYELTKDGVLYLSDEEAKAVFDRVYHKADKNYHYLAFDTQFGGYTPLNVFVTNNNPSIMEHEEAIFKSLLAKKEVCSLYPKLNLTLYPLTKLTDSGYEIDMNGIDKHFADILELNDNTYKTKYLFVNFGQGASNFDQELVLMKLRQLLEKSKLLKKIYIEFLIRKEN